MQRVQDEPDWIVVGPWPARHRLPAHSGPPRPRWPDPERPQQMHLDVRVPDFDEAEAAALRLGAARLDGGGERFRVLADPAGHPFCIVSW